MVGFVGNSHCKLDAKQRFLFPSKFSRHIFDETTSFLVINRGFDKCLNLYSPQEWERVKEPYQQLDPFDKEARMLKRMFFEMAESVYLDSNGRLMLPKQLIAFAGLQKELLLIGVSEGTIEIWNEEIYQLSSSGNRASFEELARKHISPKRVSDY